MFIDIHTHRPHAKAPGHLCVQSLYNSWEHAVALTTVTLGIHPWYTEGWEERLVALGTYARQPNVIAIGECGLDKLCTTDWTLQLRIFEAQLKLAAAIGKPLIIHCVRAFAEVEALLTQCRPGVPVIFHGFNKSAGLAQQLVRNGYLLSFGAALLTQEHVADSLRSVPPTQLFLETDAADVAIDTIYERAATLRNQSIESLTLQIHKNFRLNFPLYDYPDGLVEQDRDIDRS